MAVAPGRRVVARGERVERRGINDISWYGSIQGATGTVQLVLTSRGVTATVRIGGTVYRIEPMGGGLHTVTEIDPALLPPDHTPDNPTGAGESSGEAVQQIEPGLIQPPTFSALTSAQIDVLVVYTPSAASASGDIDALIQLAVDETNQSYVNSGVNITLSKVHTAQVSYSEAGRTFAQHVSAVLSTNDGRVDNVHSLRNTYGADVVVLVVNDAEACGRAGAIMASASTAFAAAHLTCITGNYSFAHEIGHLQGARHDRYVDSSNSPYTYGHGFIPSTKNWRTIMAYPNNCSGCPRVQYWSNPYVTYAPTGQAMGTTTYENNARVLDETAAVIGGFRSPPQPSLSVTVDGPYILVGPAGQFNWTASATGGSGTYNFDWYVMRPNSFGQYVDWTPVGAGQTLSMNVSNCDDHFYLKAIGHSGTVSGTSGPYFVENYTYGNDVCW